MYRILTFLLVLAIGTTYAQKVLTTQEAIQIALHRNTQLQKTEENLKVYQSDLKQSYGALLPNIGATASWEWQQYKYPLVTSYGTTDSRTYTLGASSDLTLFDGLASYKTIAKSNTSLKAAKLDIEKLRQETVFQTLSYYYDLMYAQELVSVKEEDVKWNQKNYEVIVEKNKLGAITLADVYSQQVKLGNAELDLLKAKNSAETSKGDFLYYLGLDVLENYTFADSTLGAELAEQGAAVDTSFGALRAMIETALQNRPDYLSSKLALNNADYDLSIAKSGYLPTLSNSLGIGYSNTTTKDLFKNSYYSAGLTLSIPIFSGWKTEYKVEAATVAARTKELEMNDLIREIKRSIQKNYLDLQTAYKQLDVSKKNVSAAQENRRIEEEKYALGSTTLLNVLIANSDYTSAITQYINAQYTYKKDKDQMQYLLGNLKSKNYE
jgi:outer membrane protein